VVYYKSIQKLEESGNIFMNITTPQSTSHYDLIGNGLVTSNHYSYSNGAQIAIIAANITFDSVVIQNIKNSNSFTSGDCMAFFF
jgi:hypothetical protein